MEEIINQDVHESRLLVILPGKKCRPEFIGEKGIGSSSSNTAE